MMRYERALMRLCRLHMVPFISECPDCGRNDREDNNEIHGNLPSCLSAVRGRYGGTRF